MCCIHQRIMKRKYSPHSGIPVRHKSIRNLDNITGVMHSVELEKISTSKLRRDAEGTNKQLAFPESLTLTHPL